MADTYNEIMPGGKSSEYLGCHTVTHECGHVIEIDNTPNDRRMHVYHASGTKIEIKDDGAIIIHAVGKTQEYNEAGREQVITGDSKITIVGNLTTTVHGNVLYDVVGDFAVKATGNITMKSNGNQLHEVGGDQRVQVNGKTSHRTSKDRDEITGGNKTVNTNLNHNETIGLDQVVFAGVDVSVGSGGSIALTASDQIGIGAGDILGLAAGTQVQMQGKTGTLIKDDLGVQISSTGGAYPSFIWAKGYKAGVFSTVNDVIMGAGGKNLLKSDGGTELEKKDLSGLPDSGPVAATGAGKVIPS